MTADKTVMMPTSSLLRWKMMCTQSWMIMHAVSNLERAHKQSQPQVPSNPDEESMIQSKSSIFHPSAISSLSVYWVKMATQISWQLFFFNSLETKQIFFNYFQQNSFGDFSFLLCLRTHWTVIPTSWRTCHLRRQLIHSSRRLIYSNNHLTDISFLNSWTAPYCLASAELQHYESHLVIINIIMLTFHIDCHVMLWMLCYCSH